MRISPSSASLEQALAVSRNKAPESFAVPSYTEAKMLSKVGEGDLKAKLYENRHGMTSFKYNVKEFVNNNMNFTQRL